MLGNTAPLKLHQMENQRWENVSESVENAEVEGVRDMEGSYRWQSALWGRQLLGCCRSI